MKRIAYLTLLILASAWHAAAQNTFTVADTHIPFQEQGEIIVNYQFEDEGEMCAYQFDLVLPEGVSLVPNGKRFKYQKGECYNAMHSIVINYVEEDNVYRVVCASLDDTYPLNGTSGMLLKLFVQTNDSLKDYTKKDAFLKNVKLSTLGGTKVDVSDASFIISFDHKMIKGDINLDGKVTIADVTALVNIILGKATSSDNSGTDINGDDKVTIADVTALVNIILGRY